MLQGDGFIWLVAVAAAIGLVGIYRPAEVPGVGFRASLTVVDGNSRAWPDGQPLPPAVWAREANFIASSRWLQVDYSGHFN